MVYWFVCFFCAEVHLSIIIVKVNLIYITLKTATNIFLVSFFPSFLKQNIYLGPLFIYICIILEWSYIKLTSHQIIMQLVHWSIIKPQLDKLIDNYNAGSLFKSFDTTFPALLLLQLPEFFRQNCNTFCIHWIALCFLHLPNIGAIRFNEVRDSQQWH